MWLKFTNCKNYTGGGKRRSAVPRRLRHNQNHSMNISDKYADWSDEQLKRLFEYYHKYTILTSKETKVVRIQNPYK